eukprot:1145929-Pelagomonas_calceolata.AAC.2
MALWVIINLLNYAESVLTAYMVFLSSFSSKKASEVGALGACLPALFSTVQRHNRAAVFIIV